MTYISVDVEADGAIPSDYSMISLGAVVVDSTLDKTFYGQLRPISDNYNPQALAVSGFTREQTLEFDDPKLVMINFREWLREVVPQGSKPIFISDNNGFDWMFVCWYFIISWARTRLVLAHKTWVVCIKVLLKIREKTLNICVKLSIPIIQSMTRRAMQKLC